MNRKTDRKNKSRSKSPGGGEAGFTLIELVFVMVLTSILGIFIFQILTNSLLMQRNMQVKKEQTDDTTLAMDQICRELRDAVSPIHMASVDELGFEKEWHDAVNDYVLYKRRSGTNQLVRLSTASSGNNSADYASLSTISASQGDIVAEGVAAFQCALDGTITMQFTGDTNASRQTRVFVRN